MKKTKIIFVSLITVLSVVLMMLMTFTACPPASSTTDEGSKTTTTTIPAALYLRGNMTGWNVMANPTADQYYKFTKTAENTYELTIDFSSGVTQYTGRPRFKFYHSVPGESAWSNDHTINGFDPTNPAGDYEFDITGKWIAPNSTLYSIRNPMQNGYFIAKVKGGMNNMTIFEDGATVHFKVQKLVLSSNPNTALSSTDTVNNYIDVTVDVIKPGTTIDPRFDGTKEIRCGASFNRWNETEPKWPVSGNTASNTYWLTADANPYEFAILNPNWSSKFCGVEFTPADVTVGTTTTKTLVWGASNAKVTVDTSGDYTFTVDFTNVWEPTLKIERQ